MSSGQPEPDPNPSATTVAAEAQTLPPAHPEQGPAAVDGQQPPVATPDDSSTFVDTSEPDPVAGFKRGAGKTSFENEKSGKPHEVAWAPPLAIKLPRPAPQVYIRRHSSRRSYPRPVPTEGSPNFSAEEQDRAASFWLAFGEGPKDKQPSNEVIAPEMDPQDEPMPPVGEQLNVHAAPLAPPAAATPQHLAAHPQQALQPAQPNLVPYHPQPGPPQGQHVFPAQQPPTQLILVPVPHQPNTPLPLHQNQLFIHPHHQGSVAIQQPPPLQQQGLPSQQPVAVPPGPLQAQYQHGLGEHQSANRFPGQYQQPGFAAQPQIVTQFPGQPQVVHQYPPVVPQNPGPPPVPQQAVPAQYPPTFYAQQTAHPQSQPLQDVYQYRQHVTQGFQSQGAAGSSGQHSWQSGSPSYQQPSAPSQLVVSQPASSLNSPAQSQQGLSVGPSSQLLLSQHAPSQNVPPPSQQGSLPQAFRQTIPQAETTPTGYGQPQPVTRTYSLGQSGASTHSKRPPSRTPSVIAGLQFSSPQTTPKPNWQVVPLPATQKQGASSGSRPPSRITRQPSKPSTANASLLQQLKATGKLPPIHEGFGFSSTSLAMVNAATPPTGSAPPQENATTSPGYNEARRIWQSLQDSDKVAIISTFLVATAGSRPSSSSASTQARPASRPSMTASFHQEDHEMSDDSASVRKNTSPPQPGSSVNEIQAPSKPHVTVHLLNKVDAVESRLHAIGGAQQQLAASLQNVNETLLKMQMQSAASSSTPLMPQVAAPPSRSGRGSRSKASRILLAKMPAMPTLEREDFTAQLQEVSSENEQNEPEGGSSSSSQQRSTPKGATAFVSPDGWVMPNIPETSPEEEAVMLQMLTPKQAQNVELTFVNRLQDAVHRHVLLLLGISSLDVVGESCPPLTDEEYANWKANKTGYFERSPFRIDFKRGWARDLFNRAARDHFVRHFLESVAGGSYKTPAIPSRYFTLEQVGLALDSHMDHARTRWRQQVNPQDAGAIERRKLQKQNNTRMTTLYIWRGWIISLYGLQEHVQLFMRLKPVHMSGDEAENDEAERAGIYTIIEAAWQSDVLKTFLRTLEATYVKNWKTVVGDRGRGGRGPRRQIAKRDAKVVDSVAPVGLWRNCYDAAWLQRQEAWVVRDLCIVDADYNFTLDTSKGLVSPAEAEKTLNDMLLAAGLDKRMAEVVEGA